MSISEEDLQYVRVLVNDALLKRDVVPRDDKDGNALVEALLQASILLSEEASPSERSEARENAHGLVHASNLAKLPPV